jgi:hypothetical protein
MKEELKKELEETSPFLLNMKEKPEALSVPNHFFNNMRVDIMNKVKIEEQQTPSAKSWFFVLKTQIQSLLKPQLAFGLASAAVVIVIGLVFFLKNTSNSQSDSCNSLACISDEETTAYIDENINDFDEKTLWESAYEQDENTSQAAIEAEKGIDKNTKLENASPEELDEIVDEMLKNGELNEEEL